ncbi:uncharacterized protein LOC131165717 isoform X2 [Malania oleifera]|uniref:uncharacterized protein LOC131165717 isoform X2 n=1 Tax=Malania oleifera TaxID=397392 RepID=UPI0025AE34C2|nr:uncharacterized protein LOC131165717 isoform X2 [Malania oleifera]
MGRKQNESELRLWAFVVLLMMGTVSCFMVYICFSRAFRPEINYSGPESGGNGGGSEEDAEREEEEGGECCRGIEHLELWGDAVKWGPDFKVNSSEDCCRACKAMCRGEGGRCLCDSWVFCGNRESCGDKFGEGIVGLETEYGVLHIKLFPDCAPHSVSYILELLQLHHCAGCQFYRAESRGSSWDTEGRHIENAAFGPPFALIQGTLEPYGTTFMSIPREACPTVRRGSVAWVGNGPDFFISLANHHEWKNVHTVFGSVLPEDMEIAEKIAQLPTEQDIWSDVTVRVLKNPVGLRRIKSIET